MMNWKSLRQVKGQSVQEYTQIFHKKDLNLDSVIYTRDTPKIYWWFTFLS